MRHLQSTGALGWSGCNSAEPIPPSALGKTPNSNIVRNHGVGTLSHPGGEFENFQEGPPFRPEEVPFEPTGDTIDVFKTPNAFLTSSKIAVRFRDRRVI